MSANYKWVPVVSDYCTGCGKCVETCPQDCLELVWAFATLKRADACISEGECVKVCPHEGMQMEWVEMNGDQDVGLWCERPTAIPKSTSWLGYIFGKRSTLAG